MAPCNQPTARTAGPLVNSSTATSSVSCTAGILVVRPVVGSQVRYGKLHSLHHNQAKAPLHCALPLHPDVPDAFKPKIWSNALVLIQRDYSGRTTRTADFIGLCTTKLYTIGCLRAMHRTHVLRCPLNFRKRCASPAVDNCCGESSRYLGMKCRMLTLAKCAPSGRLPTSASRHHCRSQGTGRALLKGPLLEHKPR